MNFNVKPRRWAQIEADYAASEPGDAAAASASAMLAIVRHLRRPPFEATLFATTSMRALCVARTNPIRWMDEMLRVTPDRDAIVFEYFWAAPFAAGPIRPGVPGPSCWRTVCPATAEAAVARLDRVLFRRLRWYRPAVDTPAG